MSLLLALVLAQGQVTVGSKLDVEGQILGEMFAQVLEETGEAQVKRRLALGGTAIALAALDSGEVDLLPEYSGNIARFVLKEPGLEDLARRAAAKGYALGAPLGFDDTYGIGLPRALATKLGIEKVSELKGSMRAGFSPEFYASDFGWPSLQRKGATLDSVRAMDHVVAYAAMKDGSIDVTDVYTTDAVIEQMDLVVLEDDVHAFDEYQALVLTKSTFPERFPKSWAALQQLSGKLDAPMMVRLNGRVQVKRESVANVAADALKDLGLAGGERAKVASPLPRLIVEHLLLVLGALALAILFGVPLGIVATRSRAIRNVVMAVTGALQTVPSIALLCFLIPVFGVGAKAAVVALFLYGLLPIVRGVVTGIESIDPALSEMAEVLGLSFFKRLRVVDLPLAAVPLMNGVQVAAVTSVGTAAVAAFIGAGGLGSLIVTGLALNDLKLVMLGAVPAAVMALVLNGVLEVVSRRVAPRVK